MEGRFETRVEDAFSGWLWLLHKFQVHSTRISIYACFFLMLRIETEEQPQLLHSLWSLRMIECFVLLPLLLCGTYTRCQWKGRCNGEGWIKEIVASCHGPQCLRIQHHKAVQRGTWKIPYRRRTATYTLTATHWRMEGSLMKTLHSLSAGAHRVLESPLWSPPYLWYHHTKPQLFHLPRAIQQSVRCDPSQRIDIRPKRLFQSLAWSCRDQKVGELKSASVGWRSANKVRLELTDVGYAA